MIHHFFSAPVSCSSSDSESEDSSLSFFLSCDFSSCSLSSPESELSLSLSFFYSVFFGAATFFTVFLGSAAFTGAWVSSSLSLSDESESLSVSSTSVCTFWFAGGCEIFYDNVLGGGAYLASSFGAAAGFGAFGAAAFGYAAGLAAAGAAGGFFAVFLAGFAAGFSTGFSASGSAAGFSAGGFLVDSGTTGSFTPLALSAALVALFKIFSNLASLPGLAPGANFSTTSLCTSSTVFSTSFSFAFLSFLSSQSLSL